MYGVSRFKKLLSIASIFGLTALFLTIFSDMAMAGAPPGPIAPVKGPGACGGALTIGGVIQCVVENSQESIGLLTALSYLFGLVIGAMAVIKVIEHVTNPHQVSAWEPMKRALVAGCLFALPMVTEAIYITLVDAPGTPGIQDGGWSGGPTGGGLDAMVVALMNDSFRPMKHLVTLFCWLAGVVLIIIGITRLLKSAQEGARGPGGFGTIMTFLVAGVLFSADEMMAAWQNTLFGGGGQMLDTNASLNFAAGLAAVEEQHILSVISAVVAFVMVLGWISFIRGWFIVRDVAEGNQQASMMAAITHIFGGALAINLGAVMNAVQETFGLSAIGVNFF